MLIATLETQAYAAEHRMDGLITQPCVSRGCCKTIKTTAQVSFDLCLIIGSELAINIILYAADASLINNTVKCVSRFICIFIIILFDAFVLKAIIMIYFDESCLNIIVLSKFILKTVAVLFNQIFDGLELLLLVKFQSLVLLFFQKKVVWKRLCIFVTKVVCKSVLCFF